MQSNVRHLVINGEYLYLSANSPGMVQKCSWRSFVKSRVQNEGKEVDFSSFESVFVGSGARIPADSYPVGMDISSDDKELIVTSQGKESGGGNSVMVFKISIQK